MSSRIRSAAPPGSGQAGAVVEGLFHLVPLVGRSSSTMRASFPHPRSVKYDLPYSLPPDSSLRGRRHSLSCPCFHQRRGRMFRHTWSTTDSAPSSIFSITSGPSGCAPGGAHEAVAPAKEESHHQQNRHQPPGQKISAASTAMGHSSTLARLSRR